MDNDALELIQRRMTEAVEAQVRARLTKVYTLLAAAFLAGAGLAGWKLYDTILTLAQARADAAVAKAEQQVRRADELGTKATFVLETSQSTLVDLTKEVRRAGADHRDTIIEIEVTLDRLKQTARKLEAELQAQRDRAGTLFAGAGNLADLAGSVKTLAEQLREIEDRLGTAGGGTGAATSPAEAKAVLDTVVEQARVQSVALPTAPTTVFFQFAVISREAAQAMADRLAQRGYKIPGLERIATADGKREIRYFHREDEAAAGRLAGDLEETLREAGYPDPRVEPRDNTGYRGLKPSPGTIELWFGVAPPHR